MINFSYEALQFTYQFLYLVERTDWYSPGLQILRLRLERLGDDDRDRLEALSAAVPGWRKLLNRGLMGAALAGILGMKFFQWYYSAQADIPAKGARCLLHRMHLCFPRLRTGRVSCLDDS
eukprot:COSAG02_NODE_1547_length_11964_cov_28.769794_2_plen_120_part_00